MITLVQLTYFVNLARERHFGRAAQASFVSQPTLSVAIKKLETSLGVTLFERQNQSVLLTPLGDKVLAQAMQVLSAFQELKHLAQAQQDTFAEPLKIGLIFTISPWLLPPLLQALQATAPKLQLMIEENYTHVLLAQLKAGILDAVVIATSVDDPEYLAYPLYDEDFVVAVPKQHAWANRSSISVDALAAESVILLNEGNCLRDQILDHCHQLKQSLLSPTHSRTFQAASLLTLRHMVGSGLGVTVLPVTSVMEDDRLLHILAFEDHIPSRSVQLVTRRSFTRPMILACLYQAIMGTHLTGVRYHHQHPLAASLSSLCD
jgi:LysR family hydrogen peroxide-inducible transcriptional activator